MTDRYNERFDDRDRFTRNDADDNYRYGRNEADGDSTDINAGRRFSRQRVFNPGTESRANTFGPDFGTNAQPGNYTSFGNFSHSYRYGGQNRQQSGPYSGRGPKNYRRSDERIQDDVCMALTQHGQIDATNIDVKTSNGIVTLSGTVDNRRTKRMVEDLVESVPGVGDVNNELKVQSGQQSGSSQQFGQQQFGWQGGQQQTGTQSGSGSQTTNSGGRQSDQKSI